MVGNGVVNATACRRTSRMTTALLPRPARTGAGPHRRPERGGGAGLPFGLCRRRARRGRCRRRARRARRIARAARRRDRQHQGSVRRRRRADPRRLENPRRRGGAGRCRRAVVRRLRAAGAVIVAKTNMTEFAFSGHRRQSAFRHAGQSARSRARARRLVVGRRGRRRRRHVRDRHRQRHRRLGAHTGGVVRYRRLQAEPAAHPDRRRVSAKHHARFDRAARRAASPIAPRPTRSWPARILRRSSRCRSPACASASGRGAAARATGRHRRCAFGAALDALDGAGVRITRDKLSLFDDMAEVNAKGGIVPPEACAIHRDRLKRRAADIDPNVRVRIERGCAVPAADYIEMMRARAAAACARMDRRLAGARCAGHADDGDRRARRSRRWRTRRCSPRAMSCCCAIPSIGNFFDLCAISLPLPAGASGRAHAAGAQRPGSHAAAHRRGGREFVRLTAGRKSREL